MARDLHFHVESCTTPNKVWTKLDGLFGKKDSMRGHQLENELSALGPKNFDNLQEFLFRFNTFLSEVKSCGIEKNEEKFILSVLSKLGPEYSLFVSSFYTTKLSMGKTWKIPSMDDFIE